MNYNFEEKELWFITGSQHLYGDEVLKEVEKNTEKIANFLSDNEKIPLKVIPKAVLTSASEIKKLVLDANSNQKCVGLIIWMHTFSPAKMWITGMKLLQKPFLHLHTQFNRDIPYSDIDMDYMNTHQSAHGGREFGHIVSRMGIDRKIVVGHWQDPEVNKEIAVWTRAACGWAEMQETRLARFGDNMRDVAVTEGDKVEAEIKMGFSVNGYALGDLVEYVNNVSEKEVKGLLSEYENDYRIESDLKSGGNFRNSLQEAARIELGMRKFLEEGNFKAFTTNFENLDDLKQLPGLAVQRLMADGYGFGAEGDWKTSALLRALKVMSKGLDGGTSFMEYYTYHLDPADTRVLGSHMLEVCESIAAEKPSLEVHPLDIGGKADPVRSVFNAPSGEAINVSLVDLGGRFRIIINEVVSVKPKEEMPKLPVARVFWKPKPDLKTAVSSWILAGGAHHTVFSQSLTADYIRDFARMMNIECITIDSETDVEEIRKELKWNEIFFGGRYN